jgi:hypothetical protein
MYPAGEPPLVFHYDREERLTHAPAQVRDYYEGKLPSLPKGLFKVRVATPQSRLLFITVVGLTALSVALGFLWGGGGRASLRGVPVSLQAFSFDGTVYVSLEMEAKEGTEPFLVTAELRLYDTLPERRKGMSGFFRSPTATDPFDIKSLEGYYTGAAGNLRATVIDYDILRVEVQLFAGDETVTLAKRVARESR